MEEGCVFCQRFEDDGILFDTRCFFVILDKNPVTVGHALVILKRHEKDIFSFVSNEWEDLLFVLHRTKRFLDRTYQPAGYNVGVNCGEAAGQTILHCHIHVMPRYKGDVENPRGGIRNIKEPLVKW